jgi:hypothetical protein
MPPDPPQPGRTNPRGTRDGPRIRQRGACGRACWSKGVHSPRQLRRAAGAGRGGRGRQCERLAPLHGTSGLGRAHEEGPGALLASPTAVVSPAHVPTEGRLADRLRQCHISPPVLALRDSPLPPFSVPPPAPQVPHGLDTAVSAHPSRSLGLAAPRPPHPIGTSFHSCSAALTAGPTRSACRL